MAQSVFAMGASHGPLLGTAPERWDERAKFDRSNQSLVFQGETLSFDELLARRGPFAAEEVTVERRTANHQANQRALDDLAARWRDVQDEVDVLVIVSSDHKEIFTDELLPGFAIYWGDTVDHVPFTAEQLAGMAPGLSEAALGDVPDHPIARPCHPALARHLIEATVAEGFDTCASRTLPAGRYGNHGIPHGWGFMYQRILGEDCRVPMVPVFVNTFFEPNPPSAERCLRFGRALGRAVESFPEDLRVGWVASGGLTHFVIDEETDRRFLQALSAGDLDHLASLPNSVLRSGTSELRNWITVAGALEATPLSVETVEYQPSYRTEAGTGSGMGFVGWR